MPFSYKLANRSKGEEKVYYNDVDNEFTFEYPCNTTYDCSPYEVNFSRGRYLLEVWGAQGGWYNKLNESLGGYSRGILTITNEIKGFLYIGGKGTATQSYGVQMGGFNGGGNGSFYSLTYTYGGGGGGASDIRLETDSFNTRIIVAGGGGGSSHGESSTSGTGYNLSLIHI